MRPHVLLLAALALFAAMPARARADASETTLTVPVGIPLTKGDFDGLVERVEWDDAARLELGRGVSARLKQRSGTLLLALECEHAWPAGARALLYFTSPEAPEGILTPGTLSIEYDAVEHDRPHLIVRRQLEMGHDRILEQVVARASRTTSGCSWEMAFPLSLLPGAKAGAPLPAIHALLWWYEPGGLASCTWPAGVTVKGGGRDLAPGLADTQGWGVLQGLEDPHQPGAFSATDWTALLAHQEEITRRGDEAHSHVRLLAEERKKRRKNDAETTAAVFENLRWIASYEPLAARDRIVWAQALRFLNRHDAAAALLESVQSDLEPSLRGRAAQERANALAGGGHYARAAEVWGWLATRPGLDESTVARLEHMVRLLREREAAFAAEWEKRAAQAETAPLLEVVTPHGSLVIALHEQAEPDLVRHVLGLVESGAYDGTLWHEVVGEAFATGGWAATREHGLDVPPEARAEPVTVPYKRITVDEERPFGFERGAVALVAQSGDSVGGSWRLLTGHRPDLAVDGDPVVGHVLSGMDVLDRIDQGERLIRVRRIR